MSTIFSPSFGNRPSFLVGREGVLDALLRGLATSPGSRERSVVMLGQRGSGKTVLLWELADRAAKMGYAVATPTVASEGMLGRIVEKIQENGERFISSRDSPRIGGAQVGALGFTVGLEFNRDVQETKSFEFKLTQLSRELTSRGHGVLILIDELQANSPEIRQLVTVYQELVGEGLNVAMVLAGLPGAVSATLNDKVLTFLNRSRKVKLGPLPLGDVRAFYERAFARLRIDVDENWVSFLAQSAQGSPYLLQLLGYNVVLRLPEGGKANEEILRAAVSASEEDYKNDVCGTTVASLSSQDVEFLVAMSQDDGASRMRDIAERMDRTQDYAQKYRRRLIDAGVIEAAGHGLVKYAVPFLRGYLRTQ